MANLSENLNPKKNPITTFFGIIFLSICVLMSLVKYIVPAFFVLKQDVPYPGYIILFPLGIGLLLFFVNDSYFERIFNRADKIIGKKTGTETDTKP